MKKSQRLDPLLALARQRERNLAGGLKKSMQRCAAHELQVTELNTYRTQYRTTVLPGQGALSAHQLKDLWCFIGKLDEALAQGIRRAAQSREQYWRDRQTFMSARMRTKVLEDRMACYRREERKAEVRRDNKEHDENVQQMVVCGRFARATRRSTE